MKSMPILPRLSHAAVYGRPRGLVDDFSDKPRPIYSVAVCDFGEAVYESPDGAFTLREGDLLFIPQDSTYRARWWNREGQLSSLHFHIDGNERRYPVQRLDGTPAIGGALRETVRLFRETDDAFAAAAAFYDACGKFWDRLVWEPRPRIDPRIRPAVDYLQAHFTEPVKVERLAALCSLSESHFFACFRQAMDTSPIEYRRTLLIKRGAQMLLESPELSVGQVADLLGFESDTYFRRVFRAAMGCPPREYRKNAGGM